MSYKASNNQSNKKPSRTITKRKITEENYVDEAESVIKTLIKQCEEDGGKPKLKLVTTTKLRNLLAMTADIYNEISSSTEEMLSNNVKSRINYLRVRFMYEAGREASVKEMIEEANLMDVLQGINGKKKNFLLFYHYMEALVAFKRYYVQE